MKSGQFFLDKAISYLQEINAAIDDSKTHKYSSWEDSPEDIAKAKRDKALKMKIKLLYKEFDNGEVFYNECIKTDDIHTLSMQSDKKLELYKENLVLFIEHIKEYRLEEPLVEAKQTGFRRVN